MSNTALNWAWEQNCSSGPAKSVLVYLANCANQAGGDCYPSIAKIALRVQHKEDTVRKAIKELVGAGLLQVESREAANGRRTSNRYSLPVVSVEIPPKTGGYAPPWGSTPPESGEYEDGGIQGSPPPFSGHTPPRKEEWTPPFSGGNTFLDTKEETKKEDSSLRSERAREANVIVLPNRVEEARAVWNEVCVPVGFPACREMPEARRRRLQQLLAGRFAAPGTWQAFCVDIAASSFLASGRFGIDWMLKPANLAKIVEGNYRDRAQRPLPARPGTLAAFGEDYQLRAFQPKFDPEPDDAGRLAL